MTQLLFTLTLLLQDYARICKTVTRLTGQSPAFDRSVSLESRKSTGVAVQVLQDPKTPVHPIHNFPMFTWFELAAKIHRHEWPSDV